MINILGYEVIKELGEGGMSVVYQNSLVSQL